EVFTRGTRIRYYDLEYEGYAESGGLTRLAAVQMYGQDGGAYPIRHTFEWSAALGGECSSDGCARPYMVDLGSVGVDLKAGASTLIDINGDALPDLLDTNQPNVHRFFANTLSADGQTF